MSNYIEGGNQLFPVFFRLDKLRLLVVGAGEVGWEKLGFMFRHCQTVKSIRVVAPEVREEIRGLEKDFDGVFEIREKKFSEDDLEDIDLVFIATCFNDLNVEVHGLAKKHGKIVNVADTPELCDFYLSSVVKKGDLKIAISSNGKSPTLTKRMRELLTDVLPEEIDDLLQNLEEIRNELKGDFDDKVNKLNAITYKMKSTQKKS